MILTTTPTIEGRQIVEYKGVVFGEVIAGVDFLRDIAASIRNLVGGRSGSYEEELINARAQAMDTARMALAPSLLLSLVPSAAIIAASTA